MRSEQKNTTTTQRVTLNKKLFLTSRDIDVRKKKHLGTSVKTTLKIKVSLISHPTITSNVKIVLMSFALSRCLIQIQRGEECF
jgi:hypothetical protein